MGNVQFDSRYSEVIGPIGAGVRLRLRLIRATDKLKLAEAFQHLSMQSRYRRFLSTKKTLTAQEVRFFTELDGVDHLAIGAFELDEAESEGSLVGVARLVRDRQQPVTAEFALAVIDARQGLGIGRRLLERLLSAAAQRGIDCLQGDLLPDNKPMQKVIHCVCPEALSRRDDGLLRVELPVSTSAPLAQASPERGATGVFEWAGSVLGELLAIPVASLIGTLMIAMICWQEIGRSFELWWLSGSPRQTAV